MRMLMKSNDQGFIELDLSLKHKVKDIGLAEDGHKDMQLSEKEMPGLMAIREKYGPEKTPQGPEDHGQPPHDHPDGHAH